MRMSEMVQASPRRAFWLGLVLVWFVSVLAIPRPRDAVAAAPSLNTDTPTVQAGGKYVSALQRFHRTAFSLAATPRPFTAGTCDAIPSGNIEVEGTGGTAATQPFAYATLQAAFAAINAGGHTGTVTVDVCGNTTETGTAVLNASGTGSASYTSIAISPAGGAARTIGGAIAAGNPLIDFNGADNVTIDGLNTGGNSLTLSNTTASATSGTSTIRFIADATGNTVTNASIFGSPSMAMGTNGGIIFFSTGASVGNDNNTISNSNIGPAGANLPSKAIYGNGSTTTVARGNSGIIISGNNIFDYYLSGIHAAVYTNDGNTDWTISNNRFYQSASRTFSATVGSVIFINGVITPNNNNLISGNTIGFANNAGAGAYTITGVSGSVFIPINIFGAGNTTATSIQGNTIAGITISGSMSGTTSTSPFRAIYVGSGLVTVGDVAGNTIGSMSATGSISYTSSSTSTSDLIAIFNFGSGNFTTNNNNIGGITGANSSTGATNIYGIRTDTGPSNTWICNNNTIGGTVADSINSNSSAAGTIVNGILNSNSIGTFTGNTVRNLTAAGGAGTGVSASVGGIVMGNSSNDTISQNTIFNLSNTNPTAATVIGGIIFQSPGTANVVERNLIYGLTSSTTITTAEIDGIRASTGTTTYRNNLVALGAGQAIANGSAAANATTSGLNGIVDGGGTNNFYHNSVYLGGTATSGAGASYAFNGVVTANTRNYRDNIFFNARTNGGASGKHYAIKINGTSPNPAGLTINNNIYLANGAGGVFGFFNGLDVASLAAWKTAAGQDAASFESNPEYLDPANSTPDLHLHPNNATVAEGNGADVGVVDDYDGQTRSGLTPVDIGADAGNFTGNDVAGPQISYTALTDTVSTANRNLAVTITDATAVDQSAGGGPRIWFRRGNSGAFMPTACASTGGTVQNATFNCTIDNSLIGGVTGGDTVQYYVAAQDTVRNIGSTPIGATGITPPGSTAPGAPNTYFISVEITAFPYTQDFETNSLGWTTGFTIGTASDWQLGTFAKTQLSRPHSGTKAFVTKLSGNYTLNTTSTLMSPVFNFSSVTVNPPTLSFWHNFKTDPGFDAGVLEMSTDGGSVWTKVDAQLGTGNNFDTGSSNAWYNSNSSGGSATGVLPPKFSDTSNAYISRETGGWLLSTTHLPASVLGAPDVRFRWVFGSDFVATDEGWAIDDVSVFADDDTPPAIEYSVLGNTISTANRTQSISVTDNVGVGSGAGLPRIYFRKGSSGTFANTQCVFTSGTNYDCSLDYSLVTGGGVTVGDTIQYYVAAQDTAPTPNVSVNPSAGASGFTSNPPAASTPPTTPSSYRIGSALSGSFDVGTTRTYTSLTNAGGIFEAINNNVVFGDITINLTSDLTSETGTVALNEFAPGFTVTIKPAGVARAISGTNANGLIKLAGADGVTIDGSLASGTDRSLTITNASTTGAEVWIATNATGGANNNTVQNCNLSGPGAFGGQGIMAGSGMTLGNAADFPNSNNTIRNNGISRVQNAVFLNGNAAALDQNWVVTGNTLGSAVAADKLSLRGIFISNAQDMNVSDNTIDGISSSTASSSMMSGIHVSGNINGGSITRNAIKDIKQNNAAGWGSNGIYLTAATTASNLLIANNFISDVASQGFAASSSADNGYGIMIDSGAGYKIYNNTVDLNTDQVAAGSVTAAINVGAAVTTACGIDLRNNILANTQTVGTRYGIINGPATENIFSAIDYNDYFAQNVGGTGGSSNAVPTANSTLLAWQTLSTQDANSKSVDPLFVAATDFHLTTASTLIGAGVSIPAVTNDIDNDPRPAIAPEIGADEIVMSSGGSAPAGTFYNASFGSLGTGDTLAGDITVTGMLTLTGIVDAGSFTLTVDCGASVVGAGPSDYVIGNVKKNFCGTGVFNFPVGTPANGAARAGRSHTPLLPPVAPEYTPMTATINSGTFPSALTVKVTDTWMPGTSTLSSLSRYWDVTETGDLNADMTFQYLDEDVYGNENGYAVVKSESGVTSTPPGSSVNPAANTFTATNISSFSQWGAGLIPTASGATLGGRVLDANGRPIVNARLVLNSVRGQSIVVQTGPFGYYSFSDLQVGTTYVVTLSSGRFTFSNPSRVINLNSDAVTEDFVADAP